MTYFTGKEITVGKLIKTLKKYPKDLKVYIECKSANFPSEAIALEAEKIKDDQYVFGERVIILDTTR
jgi:hypothetical protein